MGNTSLREINPAYKFWYTQVLPSSASSGPNSMYKDYVYGIFYMWQQGCWWWWHWGGCTWPPPTCTCSHWLRLVMSWAKQWANPYHHSWKQPFGREGTDQWDKLWLWKQHAMLHKAMQMQGFHWGGICYQYVNVYSFRYFVISVSLIIIFAWGIPTFKVFWKNVCFDPCISVDKSCICRPIFILFLNLTKCKVLIPLFQLL